MLANEFLDESTGESEEVCLAYIQGQVEAEVVLA